MAALAMTALSMAVLGQDLSPSPVFRKTGPAMRRHGCIRHLFLPEIAGNPKPQYRLLTRGAGPSRRLRGAARKAVVPTRDFGKVSRQGPRANLVEAGCRVGLPVSAFASSRRAC